MNHTELAFVNQQLADMLRCGLPLEGSLKQLCANMRRGRLRSELELLERDLAAGVPLAKAVEQRKLPEFYRRLLELGARSHDLPGILTMLADYYETAGAVWTQLKGLMVYPVIVLVLSLAFSAWAAVLGRELARLIVLDRPNPIFQATTRVTSGPVGKSSRAAAGASSGRPDIPMFDSYGFLWVPPILLACVCVPAVAAVTIPAFRRRLAWRLPAFREASLSRAASALAVLLKAGAAFPEAVALVEHIERGTPAHKDLIRWRQKCSEGAAKFPAIAAGSRIFPPMFIWLIAGAGEDLAAGFQRAARVYQARSAYRTNVLLFAALPVSLLFLGLIILSQVYPIGRLLFELPRLLF